MSPKPLPPHKAKQLLETLRRSLKDLEVYELDALPDQQQKELMKRERAWVVVKPK
jgi:hypothetical protein